MRLIVRIASRATAVGLVCFTFASLASAQQPIDWNRVVSAEERVQTLPILQRPNRIGHFYGNTIRRVYYGRYAVNRGRYRAPVRRFFYLP